MCLICGCPAPYGLSTYLDTGFSRDCDKRSALVSWAVWGSSLAVDTSQAAHLGASCRAVCRLSKVKYMYPKVHNHVPSPPLFGRT